MKLLTPKLLTEYHSNNIQIPAEASYTYPEKVLQFGTGVLLRGLPDYYIDKANKQDLFKGRIVVVKSTAQGGVSEFTDQSNIYTTIIKGIENGQLVERYIVNNSISCVLEASTQWAKIVEIAKSPDLEIIISNTTEVGIVMSEDKIKDIPPSSFPGKLLSILYQRYLVFNGDITKGLVILPTELISDNGKKLKEIIIQLATNNNLSQDFINWLLDSNDFCNTLVDRIVPGKLPLNEQMEVEKHIGFSDKLMIMAEPFALWAIESQNDRVVHKLAFASVDSSILLVPSIEKYKEIKLRLLNATHTFSCAVALLAGFNTVKEAMQNSTFKNYVQSLMKHEIGSSIVGSEISKEEVDNFSNSVIDRFSNPFLEHKWSAIAMNYTSKINMRCIPLLEKWFSKTTLLPRFMALGFASYLLLMDSDAQEETFYTKLPTNNFIIQDEYASEMYQYWQKCSEEEDVIFKNKTLWGTDLTSYDGFLNLVLRYMQEIKDKGILQAIESIL